ncbi:MAG: amidohydrolase family protein [Marinirhabdus sp.]
MKLLKPLLFFIALSCNTTARKQPFEATAPALPLTDRHVHIISPQLLADFKAQGVPFPNGGAPHTNVDTIFNRNNAQQMHLVGMGYLYSNSDFYLGNDAKEKAKAENDFLAEVKSKHPNTMKAFFGIDPLLNGALAEVMRCRETLKLDGVKMHFANNKVYLSRPGHLKKVLPIFEYAAKNGMPILLHFDNGDPKFGTEDVRVLVSSVLSKVKPLTLTIAHFGTSGGFNKKTEGVLSAFKEHFESGAISEKHRVRFDISAVALNRDSEGVQKLSVGGYGRLRGYLDTVGLDRVVFGSDYPLYTAGEYLGVLREKLKLTDSELAGITSNKD